MFGKDFRRLCCPYMFLLELPEVSKPENITEVNRITINISFIAVCV